MNTYDLWWQIQGQPRNLALHAQFLHALGLKEDPEDLHTFHWQQILADPYGFGPAGFGPMTQYLEVLAKEKYPCPEMFHLADVMRWSQALYQEAPRCKPPGRSGAPAGL